MSELRHRQGLDAEAVRREIQALMPRAFDDLATLVSIPSVADPTHAPPEECERAADWVAAALAEIGLENVAAHPTADGSKAVIGESPAPDGAPTVLLYSHYDVQPADQDAGWSTPPFELCERNGRWYGRGTADCKGSVVAHLTALRALGGGPYPVGVKVVVEGSEEQATGGLDALVAEQPELLRADAIVIADTSNFAAGVPTLTTSLRGIVIIDVRVEALAGVVHSGMFGGPAPDPLGGLIQMLGSLSDPRGKVTIDGLAGDQTWDGNEYPVDRFRADAAVLDGVELIGGGAVADALWAQPAVTVLGIDAPAVKEAVPAVQPGAGARVSLRFPPGIGARVAEEALIEHLRRRVPWGLRTSFESVGIGEAFAAPSEGPATEAMKASLELAYRQELFIQGQGGSIPLCGSLAIAYPDAEMLLVGVIDPGSQIHAGDESVDPASVEGLALTEALFLGEYARAA